MLRSTSQSRSDTPKKVVFAGQNVYGGAINDICQSTTSPDTKSRVDHESTLEIAKKKKKSLQINHIHSLDSHTLQSTQ